MVHGVGKFFKDIIYIRAVNEWRKIFEFELLNFGFHIDQTRSLIIQQQSMSKHFDAIP